MSGQKFWFQGQFLPPRNIRNFQRSSNISDFFAIKSEINHFGPIGEWDFRNGRIEMRKLWNPVPIQALINWLMSFHSSQVRCKWHKIQEAKISHKKLPEIFSKYCIKGVFWGCQFIFPSVYRKIQLLDLKSKGPLIIFESIF